MCPNIVVMIQYTIRCYSLAQKSVQLTSLVGSTHAFVVSAILNITLNTISYPEPTSLLLRMLDENEGKTFLSSMRSKKLEGSGYEISLFGKSPCISGRRVSTN